MSHFVFAALLVLCVSSCTVQSDEIDATDESQAALVSSDDVALGTATCNCRCISTQDNQTALAYSSDGRGNFDWVFTVTPTGTCSGMNGDACNGYWPNGNPNYKGKLTECSWSRAAATEE